MGIEGSDRGADTDGCLLAAAGEDGILLAGYLVHKLPWHMPSWKQPPTSSEEEEDFQQASSTLCFMGKDNSSLAKQHSIPWSFPVAGHHDLTLNLNRLPGKWWQKMP